MTGIRTQVLSYGGGVQTVAMVAAVIQGKLSRPDYMVIADTSREKTSTWDYLDEVIQPALAAHGLRVEVASHDLSTVDLHGTNGDLLVPVYTKTGKLPTFCSNEWKQRVIMRWLRAQNVEQCDVWIGFSIDEAHRAKPSQTQWFQRRFPLLELGMTRADCKVLIEEMGWPMPYKSACWMCPNMRDDEWAEMRDNYPDDFRKATELEAEIREWDGEVTLHGSGVPLSQVKLDPDKVRTIPGHHQCALGFCWV